MFIDLRYTVGYKTALRHVVEWFNSHSDVIRLNKLRSFKGCMFLLKKLLEKADWLMQEGSDYTLCLTWEETKAAGGDASYEEWKNRMSKRKKKKGE